MKAALILHIALDHFAQQGYEGASLQDIACEAGIKKPSIYAHYKGKDDLFLSAMQYSLTMQRRHLASYFSNARTDPLEGALRGFFIWLERESAENAQMKFILRAAYFPPLKLEEEIGRLIQPFYDKMHRHLARWLRERDRREGLLYSEDFGSGALAFLTVVEGAMTDLVYRGPTAYEKRVRAVWPVFWRGFVR